MGECLSIGNWIKGQKENRPKGQTDKRRNEQMVVLRGEKEKRIRG